MELAKGLLKIASSETLELIKLSLQVNLAFK